MGLQEELGPVLFVLRAVCVRKKTAGRKEKRREIKEKKKGRKKRKGEKMGNFLNMEISEKIKDNL
jgi:hypothetical protein